VPEQETPWQYYIGNEFEVYFPYSVVLIGCLADNTQQQLTYASLDRA
jgi:hypothetical protein